MIVNPNNKLEDVLTVKNRVFVIRGAFTLIELVVSMAVLAVLMMIMMSFFSAAQQSWTASSSRSEVYDNARVAMDLMARDLQCAAYKLKHIPFWKENDHTLYFVSDTAIPSDNATSSRSEIGYTLDTTNNVLYRSVTSNDDSTKYDYWDKFTAAGGVTDAFSTPSPVDTSGGTATTAEFREIIPNVVDLKFTTNGFDQYSFPKLVKIEMTLLDRNDYKKWVAIGGNKSNPSADSGGIKDFRENHERKFTKYVFLDDRGQ